MSDQPNTTAWWFRKPRWLNITNGQWVTGLGFAIAVFIMIVGVTDNLLKVLAGLYLAHKAFEEGKDTVRTEPLEPERADGKVAD